MFQFPFRHRQKAALSERRNVTKAAFVGQLAQSDLERRAAGKLWDLLVDAAVVEDFRPLPDDDFLRLYGLADEDLDDDIIFSILQSVGLTPSSEVITAAGVMRSPKDFIRLVRLAESVTPTAA